MEKNKNMDSDEGGKQTEVGDNLIDGDDVLPPSWLRCGLLHATISSGFLRSYHSLFLPSIAGILWALYFFIGN